MKARNKMLWRDLWHLRGQVFAAAMVVACGVSAFLAMRATYESLLQARNDYYQDYRFADVFAQLKRAPQSLAARIEEIAGVAQVRTRVVLQVTLDVPGLDEPASARLVSIPDRARPMLNDLVLRRGRYVEPERDDEAVVSEAFAVANQLSPGDTLAAVINGRWKSLRLVGVALSPEYIYEVGPGTILPDNRRFGVLWMGEKALASAYKMEGAFNDVAIGLAAGASEGDVIEHLDTLLTPYGGLGAYGREEQVSHRFISDEISQNRITSTFVPGIFLGVAAFLLHTVLARLTSMQRTEIGLLKAFGYSDWEVGLHYLKLALVTVSLGLLVGTAFGAYAGSWLTALYRDFYRFPNLTFAAGPRVVSLTLLIALASAVVGAMGAVRQAIRLPPAVAMRPEPPATFHAGIFERLGLTDHIPSSARMVARNIERRPWKAFLAVLGIACAVGILVLGRFGIDAMNAMMHTQFAVVQRDDVTVIFREPATARIRHDLTRLPGVLAVEPFRSVPARLRFEHRSKRIEVTGLPEGGFLRRLVDMDERPVPLPREGLLLTRKLSEILGVRPGERVQVEVLEGARPLRVVQVAGFIDEPVGLNAYIDMRALHALMQEQGSLSGAYLSIDPQHAAALNRELKRLPMVAGIAFREAVLRSFGEILERSMGAATVLNTFFACVIAFGVVYNGARIALSERGNELASLRVLGFTRREVIWLLLAEQGLLTTCAIPLGFGFGAWIAWLLVQRLNTELYRIPLAFETSTFSFALLVVSVAALLSGLLVARRIQQLDLIAVLKTRE